MASDNDNLHDDDLASADQVGGSDLEKYIQEDTIAQLKELIDLKEKINAFDEHESDDRMMRMVREVPKAMRAAAGSVRNYF